MLISIWSPHADASAQIIMKIDSRHEINLVGINLFSGEFIVDVKYKS